MWDEDRKRCGIQILIKFASGVLHMLEEEGAPDPGKKMDDDTSDTPF